MSYSMSPYVTIADIDREVRMFVAGIIAVALAFGVGMYILAG